MTAAAAARRRVITAAAFTGLLIACAFLIFRLSTERLEILEDFRGGARLSVQAQAEFLRLSEALSRYQATGALSDRRELEQRVFIFWSRFPLLGSGAESEHLRQIEGIAELVAGLAARLPQVAQAMEALDPSQPASFADAHQALEPFRGQLDALVLAALQNESFSASRARIEQQYAWILAALAAVLGSGTLLVLGLRREALNARASYELARRAEAEASDLKERLVDAIESISEGFILIDSAGRVVMANSRYRELYPLIGEMVEPGLAFQDLVWAGAALHQFGGDAPVETVVRERMERLAYPLAPFEQTLGDGRILLVSERRTARGSLVSVATDITELKRTQHALQSRLAAMEASIDGIAFIDVSDRLVWANRAFAAIFGFPAEAIVGDRWSSLFDDAENARFDGEIQPRLRAAGLWRGERRARRRDGTAFPLEVSMTILDDGGMICIARDATEQHRAAAERQQLQDQFYQAQKMEALGRLSGGIAHDFNNILAAIIGYASFLLEDLEESSETQGFARQILAAGNRAKDLVQQILAFSRTHDTRRDAIDLAEVVDETLTMLSATMPATVAFTQSVARSGMIVEADATQIGQVLMNLCVNARDALPADRGSVTVELAEVEIDGGCASGLASSSPPPGEPVLRLLSDEDGRRTRMWVGVLAGSGRYARLSVRDTGSGMGRPVMERMFDPFFTTKSVGKGTGLGLAAVHGIVAAHGGAITIESTLGGGTAFQVFLPIAETPARVSAPTLEPGAPQGRELVLLVEDEAHVAAMTARALERLGYEVASCGDPRDALATFEEDPDAWDIVVTDQTMPGLTGIELGRRMLELRPGLPVLLCTGFSETVTEETARAAGMAAFLTKPIDPDRLARTVRGVLDRSAAERSGRTKTRQPETV